MDMQNVSNLVIPEGEVRTIHDKDSRLIWGRVNYDTKYAGDTYQQTYSGKNRIDFATIQYSAVNDGSGTRDGATFAVNGAPSSNWGGVGFGQTNLQLKTDTTYTFSATVASTTNPNGSRVYVGSGLNTSGAVNGNDAKAGERTVATFTTPNSIGGAAATIRLYPMLASSTAVFTDIMLEESATATSYEPYTGSSPTQIVPAPNPDYPQPIQVVTGVQTVTISDGVDSEDYTINLGSTELCKIGTYQDYIYKSGDDWYVHKAVGKTVLDGSDDETWNTSSLCYYVTLADKTKSPYGVCDHFTYSPDAFSTSNTAYRGCCTGNKNDTGLYFMPLDASQSSVALFKTWLSTNPTTAYYVLATVTDTKITDAALIGQLNAVHEWLTRYGYNATVTGNLPIIIDRSNL